MGCFRKTFKKNYMKNHLKIAIAAVFISNLIFSQEAEKIYHEEYSKLSFVIQPSILKKSDA